MFGGADGRTVAQVGASIPPPVRLLGNTVLRWRYQRAVAPVLALARPGCRSRSTTRSVDDPR
jgi:hypothetical protein